MLGYQYNYLTVLLHVLYSTNIFKTLLVINLPLLFICSIFSQSFLTQRRKIRTNFKSFGMVFKFYLISVRPIHHYIGDNSIPFFLIEVLFDFAILVYFPIWCMLH